MKTAEYAPLSFRVTQTLKKKLEAKAKRVSKENPGSKYGVSSAARDLVLLGLAAESAGWTPPKRGRRAAKGAG